MVELPSWYEKGELGHTRWGDWLNALVHINEWRALMLSLGYDPEEIYSQCKAQKEAIATHYKITN